MDVVLVCLCVLVGGKAFAANHEPYESYNLLEVKARSSGHLSRLSDLRDRWDGEDGVHFWDDRKGEGVGSLVHVAPESISSFMDDLNINNLWSEVKTRNLQSMIKKEMRSVKKSRRSVPDDVEFDFETYHTLDEIYDYLDKIASEFDDVDVRTVLQTYEGRDIKLVTVGKGNGPAVYFECGIHAREWISPAVCLNILNDLLTNESDEIQQLRNKHDFYMFPVTNPDGYVYTWNENRLWRKNRRPVAGGCTGVDLNRNFDSNFGGPGSDAYACSFSYHGPHEFSELETQAEKMVLEELDDINSVWSIHSYSELVMHPYCYSYNNSMDEDDMLPLSQKIAEQIRSVNGVSYNYGSCANTVYICSGTLTDWVYDSLGIKYSYDIELRDSKHGGHGFLLPKEQITPTFQEFWTGAKFAINEIRALNQI